MFAVADGAGSAKRAAEGSALACRVAKGAIARALHDKKNLDAIDEHAVATWAEEVHCRLSEAAESAGLVPRDFACTLLAGVVGPRSAAFLQIGDGAMIYAADSQQPHTGPYECVFWPDSGEYVNVTHFITDANYTEHIRCARVDQAINALAVFTDGLQSLALQYADRSVHGPFFTPMFRQLLSEQHPARLVSPMRAFLDSNPVNKRTDDDKTLLLAVQAMMAGPAVS